jgi:hypothetical protein
MGHEEGFRVSVIEEPHFNCVADVFVYRITNITGLLCLTFPILNAMR